jgi:hypothetical protein
MSGTELEPLSPDLLALLASEKARPRPAEAMQARVLARIGEDLLAGIPISGPAIGQGLPAPSPPPHLPNPLRRLPLGLGLVAAGGIGGAGIHAYYSRAHQSPPGVVSPSPPPSPLPMPTERLTAPPLDAPVPAKPEARRMSPPARPVAPVPGTSTPSRESEQRLTRDDELAAERALLEQARMALARHKPADALVILARHEQQFRQGRLGEERDALVILALAADRKTEQARSRAAKFREKYPRSLLLRTIDAAFESIP